LIYRFGFSKKKLQSVMLDTIEYRVIG